MLSIEEDGASVGDERASTICRRLLELGFLPGEELLVVARMKPGLEPIAVRVAGSTFALREREARLVRVERVGPGERVAAAARGAPVAG